MSPAGFSLWVPVGTCRYFLGTFRYLLLFLSFERSDLCVVVGVLGLHFLILPCCINMCRCARLRDDQRCGVVYLRAGGLHLTG